MADTSVMMLVMMVLAMMCVISIAQEFFNCETMCSYDILYVCGSDGLTYKNECQMRSANCQNGFPNVYKVHDGECSSVDRCEIECPYNIAYVCGSDGVTYNNECHMRVESCQAGNPNVFKAYEGKCEEMIECETLCPKNTFYVCGSDGKTYNNECFMRADSCLAGNRNVFKIHDGKCAEDSEGAK